MLRLLLSFLILFAGATAVVALLPRPALHDAHASSVAVALRDEADPRSEKTVRVVYPPMAGTAEPSPDHNLGGGTAPTTPPSPTTPVAVAAPASPSPKMANAAQTGPQADGTMTAPQGGSVPPADIDAILQATAKVDINTASVSELDQIPGAGRIGRAIASRRPYRSVEDLLTKRVIRKSVYDRIKDEVAAK